jgi:hypothetical protein
MVLNRDSYIAMKANRVLKNLLSSVLVGFAFLMLSGCGKSAGEKPKDLARTTTVEVWRTNTVEVWRTNTVRLWTTNTVEVWRTNIVLQPVTNEVIKEVIKEVPARLSTPQKQAATAGYQYLNAPMLPNGSDALYKASPLAVEVRIDETVRSMLAEDTDAVRKTMERALRSRNIPVAEKSPYHLSLSVTVPWATDVPSVALFMFRLELRESVALRRQNDVIGSSGIVWTATKLGTLARDTAAEEVKNSIQDQLAKFCNDYLKAKANEKEIESRLPAIPNELLSEGR